MKEDFTKCQQVMTEQVMRSKLFRDQTISIKYKYTVCLIADQQTADNLPRDGYNF